ncbi:MAG: hypothetical protein ACJ77N_09325 [Chloroflexota bacterium]|jgi:hypothetical protein
MHTRAVLLIESTEGDRQILAGDEEAFRAAFEGFVDAWGSDAVWFDPDARVLGSDAGIRLARWRARTVGPTERLALIALAGRRTAAIYLVDDSAMAERLVVGLTGDSGGGDLRGLTFDLVSVGTLPPSVNAVGSSDDNRDELRVNRDAGPRPLPPRPLLDRDRLCPRCADHPLHVEPLFDGRAADGSALCAACVALADLRAA